MKSGIYIFIVIFIIIFLIEWRSSRWNHFNNSYVFLWSFHEDPQWWCNLQNSVGIEFVIQSNTVQGLNLARDFLILLRFTFQVNLQTHSPDGRKLDSHIWICSYSAALIVFVWCQYYSTVNVYILMGILILTSQKTQIYNSKTHKIHTFLHKPNVLLRRH